MTQSRSGAYERLRSLELTIDGYDLEQHERETSSGFTRTTTVVRLLGDGEIGRGEDVTYDTDEHRALRESPDALPLEGTYRFDAFSEFLSSFELFPTGAPERTVFVSYRRWAFESAALDLALRQDGRSLAEALDRAYRPVRFVVSTQLGDPPSTEPVDRWLRLDPTLEFKVDATSGWTRSLAAELAETGAIVSVDLKGMYQGTVVDQAADLDLYELVLEELSDAIVEDPAVTPETASLFDGHEHRVAWDYPITDVDSVRERPWEPRWINIKPSRFGSLRALLETIEYCLASGIDLYGGGQFELDIGRQHLHALASLFYPDGPNDIAPIGYNDPRARPGLPANPLPTPTSPIGLDWRHRGDAT